jgi:hypothetical protein
MPLSIKLLFTAFALTMSAILVWVLRPSQPKSVGSKWFRLGARDPVFRVLFLESGRPRKFSWLLTLVWFVLWLALVWSIPSTP